MKKCPQCQTDYFDNMLEFCLDDGSRLQTVTKPNAAATKPLTAEANSVETVFFERAGETLPKTIAVAETAAATDRPKPETENLSLKQKAAEKGSRVLEVSSLGAALAHNWWQWLYVARQSSGTVSGFLFSAEFLIWILLLFAGTGTGLLALKFSSRKALAYTSLVILAINFLLLLVPRK